MIPLHALYFSLYYFNFEVSRKWRSNNLPWSWEIKGQNFSLIHQIICYLGQIFIVYMPFMYFVSLLYTPPAIYTDSKCPSFISTYSWFVFNIFLEDFFFYFIHRLLHTDFLYKKIHKIHHRCINTIHINCIYTHPIEFVIGNLLPSYVGYLMFYDRVHFVSQSVWLITRFVYTHIGHGGYDFPFTITGFNYINKVEAGFHNFHHSKNSGNYGSVFSLWDNIFGTSKPY